MKPRCALSPSERNDRIRVAGVGRGDSSNDFVVNHLLSHLAHGLEGNGGRSGVQEGLHGVEVGDGKSAHLHDIARLQVLVQLRDGRNAGGAKRGDGRFVATGRAGDGEGFNTVLAVVEGRENHVHVRHVGLSALHRVHDVGRAGEEIPLDGNGDAIVLADSVHDGTKILRPETDRGIHGVITGRHIDVTQASNGNDLVLRVIQIQYRYGNNIGESARQAVLGGVNRLGRIGSAGDAGDNLVHLGAVLDFEELSGVDDASQSSVERSSQISCTLDGGFHSNGRNTRKGEQQGQDDGVLHTNPKWVD